MVNGWTPERRARQAELIRTWQPWQKANGPRTPEGKARTSRNAFKGGALASAAGAVASAQRRAARTRGAPAIGKFHSHASADPMTASLALRTTHSAAAVRGVWDAVFGERRGETIDFRKIHPPLPLEQVVAAAIERGAASVGQ